MTLDMTARDLSGRRTTYPSAHASRDSGRSDPRERLTALHQAPVFAKASAAAMAFLTARAQKTHFRTGQIIIDQGAEADALYVIAGGWVQVMLGSDALGVHADMALEEYGPGEVLGECALLATGERVISAIALEPVSCFVIPRDDLLAVIDRYPSVARALLALVSDRLRDARRRIARETRDPLTNLPNRSVLYEFYPRAAARLRRLGGTLSVALLDVDRLKIINDSAGHAAGDAVLQAVGQALHTSIRATDLAVRYGGDEFVLVLPGADSAGARQVIDRMFLALEECPGLPGKISLSYGVAGYRQQGRQEPPSLDTLLAKADQELYRGKEQGRSGLTSFGAAGSGF